MSLNLNIVKRNLLVQIGGINEQYSGGYNDLLLLMSIRNLGYRVLLVGETRVVHIGRMTVEHGTNFNKKMDDRQFTQDFPEYRTEHGKWGIKHWKWPFATSLKSSLFWWISQNASNRKIRRFFEWMTIWLEPELSKYPTRLKVKQK